MYWYVNWGGETMAIYVYETESHPLIKRDMEHHKCESSAENIGDSLISLTYF